MSSESELQTTYNSYNSQRSQAEQDKRAIDAKIARLKTARDQIAQEKQAIDDLRQAVRKRENPDEAWKGNRRDTHSEYVKSDFRTRYNNYYDGVDDLHDAIIRRIAQLQNESRNLGGWIGWLVDQANNLWAEIQSLVN
ncbi:MAG: DUF5082 domain-containing protein [Coriobacteriia bacterium]|nr:DUF5082 domain-containing protein [Coriobacteriia bacterium]